MSLVKPQAPPGFLSQATQVMARSAWFAGNLVRWRTGYLEKMGGWRRLIEEALAAPIRRFHAWLDLSNRKNLLIAADDGVRLLVQSTLYSMGHEVPLQGGFIPAIGVVGDITTFTVALNATEVTVETGANVNAGDIFFVKVPVSIGGRILLAGEYYPVKTVIPGTGFTFDMPLPALAAEADTYGIPLMTNDIVNGFTVTWKAHGLVVGSQIRVAQGTTLKLGTLTGTPAKYDKIDFVAPAGTLGTVATVTDADHFTFLMGASGTGDGTGGTDHQVYVGSSIVNSATAGITAASGAVLGFAAQLPLNNPQKQAWFLGNMGEDGLALLAGGPLEVYTPPIENGPFLTPVGAGSPATAPQKSNGFIVAMPQAQVILFGSEVGKALTDGVTKVWGDGVVDPLLITWSDVGTYDDYQLSVSKQAGSFRLSRGSRIVGAIQAPQATLILTDTDVWQMSYIGPPLIYGFTIMGSGCGLVAPHAISTVGRTTIWQGQKNFWSFETGVQPVVCTVWDYIFDDIDPVNINKCHAAPNSTTNEMAFYFPSQHTMINVDANLLLFSQVFNRGWLQVNAIADQFLLFHALYLYEAQYLISGWFDDSGMTEASWWDQDIGGEVEKFIFAPDGTDTVYVLNETSVNGMHAISQTIDKNGERTTYTFSVYVHKDSTRNLTLRAGNPLGYAYATFNPASGNLVARGVTSPKFAVIDAMSQSDGLGTGTSPGGNGWLRYVLTFTSDDSQGLEVFINLTKGTELSYAGEGKGLLLWGAQLVLGSEPLTYQRTNGIRRQNETGRYVKVNLVENMAWDSGRLRRTAWLDESVWGPPLGGDPGNMIQQHEIGFDADDKPMEGVFAETGFSELGDGTAVMLVDEVHPDLKWFGRNGGVKISIRATNYPQGPKHLYGPYSMTPGTSWFTPRVRARYMAIRYDWEPRLGFSARIGLVTFRTKPAGKLP
jgi:hypothetical protein